MLSLLTPAERSSEMENSFSAIKAQLPIKEYLENETNSEIKAVGEGKFRVNPCPLCSHNDCFTIYGRDQSFHCFSCEVSGDVIHLEKEIQHLSSNSDAAESLARRYGVNEVNQYLKGAQADGVINSPNDNESMEFAQSHRKLRGLVAEYYHQQLLRNEEALNYQVQVRMHSIEILKHFKVGIGGGDLIGHATKNGYSVEDLESVGLVKKMQGGYRAYIPNGFYIYPHWFKGEVVFFTIKDPAGKKKFQIPKKYSDPDWLCMNQDVLNKDQIFICEGENDLLSIIDKAKQPNAVAVIGNFNTTQITDWLRAHSAGKKFYLAFDRDGAGEKYAAKYAAVVSEGGGQAFKVEIPAPYKDVDEFLSDTKDPVIAFKHLMDAASELTRQKGDGSLLAEFKSFQVLGELADDRIAIWSKINRKIYKVTTRDLNLDKLDQIGGKEVTMKVCRKSQEGKIPFRQLKRELVTEASKSQLGNPDYLGQGIHLLRNGSLLIVNGSDSWVWNGKKFVSSESPLIEQKFIDWKPGYEWI